MSGYYGSKVNKATFHGFVAAKEAPKGYLFCPSVGAHCRAYIREGVAREFLGKWGIESYGWGNTFVPVESLSDADFLALKSKYKEGLINNEK